MVNPTIADFKSYFFRDFPYATDPSDLTKVQDQDITNALQAAKFNVNPVLLPTQEKYTYGFLLLAAHNLVMNLRGSSQGLSGQYSWLEASKSVGSVSTSYSIPPRILNNPLLAMFSKTSYGARYIQLVLPLLSGQVFTVAGATSP